MKKVLLSLVAAIALSAAPAFAADMPVKALKAPAAAASPWDVAFGTALTSDYILRGISQSNRKPAVQGYYEVDYTAASWLTLYSGTWGSSLWTGFANAEFDVSGGGRFTFDKFSLDVGAVYYYYPCNICTAFVSGSSSISYAEVYAKPSYKVADWLTIGGQVYWGDNFGNSGESATYYTGNVAITLPQFMPMGIGTVVSAEVGRQTYDSTLRNVIGYVDYTQWNVGVSFNYKAITLDVRYYDTNAPSTSTECNFGVANAKNPCGDTVVATLKFDTTVGALK